MSFWESQAFYCFATNIMFSIKYCQLFICKFSNLLPSSSSVNYSFSYLHETELPCDERASDGCHGNCILKDECRHGAAYFLLQKKWFSCSPVGVLYKFFYITIAYHSSFLMLAGKEVFFLRTF